MTSWKSEFYCSNSDVIFLVTSSSLHKNQLVDKNLPFLINDNACTCNTFSASRCSAVVKDNLLLTSCRQFSSIRPSRLSKSALLRRSETVWTAALAPSLKSSISKPGSKYGLMIPWTKKAFLRVLFFWYGRSHLNSGYDLTRTKAFSPSKPKPPWILISATRWPLENKEGFQK